MLLIPGRLRLITRIFLALLLTLSAMSAAVFWLLQRNPEALAQHYIEQIAASTGLNITVESVNVALLPLPSLAVSNASVEGKHFNFTVAYATLRPDFLALLRGELLPRNITLLRPRLKGELPVALSLPFLLPDNAETAQPVAAQAAPVNSGTLQKTSPKSAPQPAASPTAKGNTPPAQDATIPALTDAAVPSQSVAAQESPAQNSIQSWLCRLAGGSTGSAARLPGLLPGRFRLAV